jgi:hypothetical protein
MKSLFALLLSLLISSTTPALAGPFGNQTTLTYDPGHGTQIEYVAANGTSYLWYPGNRVVLPGHWKRQGKDICWAYGANTYNPVTGQHGGGFECEPLGLYASSIVETAKGDVFGLAHRTRVPFQLTRTATTIATLLKRAVLPAASP